MSKLWHTPGGQYVKFYLDEVLPQKHLLIAGSTGCGKSTMLNGILHTGLLKAPIDIEGGMHLILIDQKGVELQDYRDLPHTLMYAVKPYETMRALRYAVGLMMQRYEQVSQQRLKLYPGSDIYVVIDEWADVLITCGKEAVKLLQRLAQLGRAARIHIILCTQTPLAKILPTEIRCNFDARIGMHTNTAGESRLIIDRPGCEKLPSYGAAMIHFPGKEDRYLKNVPLISDDDIRERVQWWVDQKDPEEEDSSATA